MVLEKTTLGDTPESPQFGLRLTRMEPLLALNRENAALLFWESRYLKSVWLSEAVSQRKIAANSTYLKVKVRGRVGRGSGRGLWEGKKGVIKTRTGIIPRIQSFIDTA